MSINFTTENTMQTHAAPFADDIKKVLQKVGSRKRKCVTYTEVAGSPMRLRSYWDGGSRTVYTAFDARGQRIDLPVSGAPQFTPEPKPWVPQAGDVLVETGTFCGKESTPYITFYI